MLRRSCHRIVVAIFVLVLCPVVQTTASKNDVNREMLEYCKQDCRDALSDDRNKPGYKEKLEKCFEECRKSIESAK